MGRRHAFRVSLLLLLASLAGAADTQVLTGKVVGVADGDTPTLLVKETPVRIRLAGIDAPERRQPFATRAGNALGDKVFGKTVTVLPMGQDDRGLTIGVIYIDVNYINTQPAWIPTLAF